MNLKFLKEEYSNNYGVSRISLIHCDVCGNVVWIRNGSVRSSLCGSLYGHEYSMSNEDQLCKCSKYEDGDEVIITGGPSTTFGYGAEVWIKKSGDDK